MNILRSVIIVLVIFITPLSALAGQSSGLVSEIIVNGFNYLFFSAGTKSGSPACGNNNSWALNLSTAKGRSIYALVLTAQAQGKSLVVVGNNTCNEWGDREDVLYAYMVS